MTAKLLVRQGGGAAAEVDYASAFSGRKGSPFITANAPLVQMGQRFQNGECAQGYFKVVDPQAELSSAGFRLRPWAEVKLTEDASGDELIIAWMRLSSGDVGRRGVYIPGDEIEHSPQLMDSNLDVRGIPFVPGWVRPAETDWDRLEALQLAKLAGSSSTSALFRETTDITVDRVSNGHLVKADPETDLEAHKYPKGTEVAEIIEDIAEQSGKIWGVVLHHDGGSTHKCLLYIDQDDLETWTTDVRISDDVADWDPDHPTAPVFEPHWLQGSGKEADYSGVISGLISIYDGPDDNRQVVTVETGEDPDDWETFWAVYNDGESTNDTQAERRANWILQDRKRPRISHRVSILVTAAQAHLATAGQAIEVKSVVLNSGPDKESWVWRRIAESKLEPAPDGLYWLHLSLERPRLSRRAGGGPGQPASTATKPARPGFVETDATWRTMLHATQAAGEINPEPTNWKEVGFDDSVSPWQDAHDNFFDGHPDVTEITHRTGAPNDFWKEREVFYRREYWINADQLTGSDVDMYGYIDDGATVYVNGSSVYSQGTPFTGATGTFSTTVARSAFQEGLNCIAVYGWNENSGTDGTAPNPGGTGFGLRIEIEASDRNLGDGDTGDVLPADSVTQASLITITDLGGYYDSGNVEGALQEAALQKVRKNSTGTVFERNRLNFIEGTNVTLTVADDSGNDEVDITIAATGGAGLGAWTTFTPTWTTSGTAPSIGNGSIAGRYKALDSKTYLIEITFIAGSTTTFGTGTWSFALPGGVTANATVVLAGYIEDSGTDNKLCVGVVFNGATTVGQIVPEGGNVVTNTVPQTWAASDKMTLTGTVEAQ